MIALALIGGVILVWIVSLRLSSEDERDANAVDEYLRALECLAAAHSAVRAQMAGERAERPTADEDTSRSPALPGGSGPWPVHHFRVLRPDEVSLESRRRLERRRSAGATHAATPSAEGPTWLRPRITVVPPPVRLPVASHPLVFGESSDTEAPAEAHDGPGGTAGQESRSASVIPLARADRRAKADRSRRHGWGLPRQATRVAATMLVAMAVGVISLRAGDRSEDRVLDEEALTEHSAATSTTAVTPSEATPAAVTLINQTGDESHYRVATAPVRLAIVATERCWVRATTADGITLWEGIIIAGEERVIESPGGLSLRLGMPRAVKLTIGDATVGVGDGSPRPHTVVFAASGPNHA